MKFLIYKDRLDAIERNHEEGTKRMWPRWLPITDHDSPYWWAMQTHPTSGEVALQIPDEDAEVLPEAADLDDTLDPSWYEEVI